MSTAPRRLQPISDPADRVGPGSDPKVSLDSAPAGPAAFDAPPRFPYTSSRECGAAVGKRSGFFLILSRVKRGT